MNRRVVVGRPATTIIATTWVGQITDSLLATINDIHLTICVCSVCSSVYAPLFFLPPAAAAVDDVSQKKIRTSGEYSNCERLLNSRQFSALIDRFPNRLPTRNVIKLACWHGREEGRKEGSHFPGKPE